MTIFNIIAKFLGPLFAALGSIFARKPQSPKPVPPSPKPAPPVKPPPPKPAPPVIVIETTSVPEPESETGEDKLPKISDLKTKNVQPVTAHEIALLGKHLAIDPQVIRGVFAHEAGGKSGFDPEGRPVMLFEYHQFSARTGGAFDKTHPHISNRVWKAIPYPTARTKAGRDQRWAHLAEAYSLAPRAALESASYGLFQIMGFNHAMCGYKSVFDFVRAMASGLESDQLTAWMKFLHVSKLVAPLQTKDFYGFARYNVGGLSAGASPERKARYEADRKRYADSISKSVAREYEQDAKAASFALVSVDPTHDPKCGIFVNVFPPKPCSCGAERFEV